MAPTYTIDGVNATYNLGNASRFIRVQRNGLYSYVAIWDPPTVSPVTGETFSGPRPVAIHEAGGARRKASDFNFNSSTAGVFTDELGAYIVIVGVSLGGLDVPSSEEFDCKVHPESIEDSALAVMLLRGNRTNPAVCGSTFTFSSELRQWMMWTDSAGAWHGLLSQLVPVGEYAELADELSARGDGFRYSPDHRVGKFYYFEGQNRISTRVGYRTDDALDGLGAALPSTYTVNGATAAGATSVPITGDTVQLFFGNWLQITTTTSYVTTASHTTGSSAVKSLSVSSDTDPIPQGAFIVVSDGVDDHEALVTADYAGGSGNVSVQWTTAADVDTINAGTTVRVRYTYAVKSHYWGGAGSVSVFPVVQHPIANATEVVVLHPAQEALGIDRHAWGNGYVYRSSDDFVWASDDDTGRGFPLERKRQADVDYLVHDGNPNVQTLSLLIVAPSTACMKRVDTLSGERSFWYGYPKEPTGNTRAEVEAYVEPWNSDLHDESDAMSLAYQWYLQGGDVEIYAGDRRSNPSGTVAELPFLKGRRAAASDAVVKAWAQSSNRRGGSIL